MYFKSCDRSFDSFCWVNNVWTGMKWDGSGDWWLSTTDLGKNSSIFLITRWFIWTKSEVLFKVLKEKGMSSFLFPILTFSLSYILGKKSPLAQPTICLASSEWPVPHTIAAVREFSGSWSCKWAYITWVPFALQLNRMILILMVFPKLVPTISFNSHLCRFWKLAWFLTRKTFYLKILN